MNRGEDKVKYLFKRMLIAIMGAALLVGIYTVADRIYSSRDIEVPNTEYEMSYGEDSLATDKTESKKQKFSDDLASELVIRIIVTVMYVSAAMFFGGIVLMILSFFVPTGEELENSSRFVKFLARIVQRHFR